MNHSEAVLLCRYVRAACPQQKLDEYTPDVWADLLASVRFEDARLAVTRLASNQPFVAPSEIRAEVKRIRKDRCDHHEQPIPPRELSAVEAARWVKDAWRRIGDGEVIEDTSRGQLKARPSIPVLTKGISA
jgi:hypothetical protein